MDTREAATALSAQRISLETIDAVVAARLGETRVRSNAQPAIFNRQVAMYLAKQVGGWSTARIGRFYNGRDHSTVCHALQRIEMLRDSDPDIDELLSTLTHEIKAALPGHDQLRQEFGNHPASPIQQMLLNHAFLDLLADRIMDRIRIAVYRGPQ
jgi:predicted RNA-binding Zn ribbon-like protein